MLHLTYLHAALLLVQSHREQRHPHVDKTCMRQHPEQVDKQHVLLIIINIIIIIIIT